MPIFKVKNIIVNQFDTHEIFLENGNVITVFWKPDESTRIGNRVAYYIDKIEGYPKPKFCYYDLKEIEIF